MPNRFRRRRFGGPGTLLVALLALLAVVAGMAAVRGGSGDPERVLFSPGERRSGETGQSALELVDVAGEIGLNVRHSAFRWGVSADPVAMMGGGLCWIDVDGDGWQDLFLTDTWSDGEWGRWDSSGGLPTTRIFRNVGGLFEEFTDEWGAGIETRSVGCVAADFDNDGFTDLYVTTDRENLLLWNDDGSGFVEGARLAGVGAYGWHTGVAAGDLDGDGNVDLFVAGYADLNKPRPNADTGFPNTFEPVVDLLFMNNGPSGDARPTFRSVATEVGVEPEGLEYGLGVMLVDFDGDGDLDVHVANDTQPNRLYRNEGADGRGESFRLADVGEAVGVDDPNSGMGIASGDINDDRFPDFVVTNLAGQGHAGLMSVDGVDSPEFEPGMRQVSELGMDLTGWGASFGDLDLDGDLDLILASGDIPIVNLEGSGGRTAVFLNDGGELRDGGSTLGLGDIPERNGRSVALADYDNDGDLDAAISAVGQPLVLLQNRGVEGHWLVIDPGVPDPGLRVRLSFDDGTGFERAFAAGSSWLSGEGYRIVVGVGAHESVAVVEITRSDGSVVRLEGVAVDQTISLPAEVAEP